MTGYVYRCYDTHGDLIYVGSTIDVNARMTVAHRIQAWWFHQVEQVASETFPSIGEAQAAEKRIIRAELPRWNVHHKPKPTTLDGLLDLIAAIENGPNPRTWHNRRTLARLRDQARNWIEESR